MRARTIAASQMEGTEPLSVTAISAALEGIAVEVRQDLRAGWIRAIVRELKPAILPSILPEFEYRDAPVAQEVARVITEVMASNAQAAPVTASKAAPATESGDEVPLSEAARMCYLTRTRAYDALLRGDLQGRKVGGRWIVTRASATDYGKKLAGLRRDGGVRY